MAEHKRMGEVIDRLARIQGHVQGVMRMAEEGRACEDLLIQLTAIKAAVEQAARIILEDHMECCVLEGIENGNTAKTIDDLKRALAKII